MVTVERLFTLLNLPFDADGRNFWIEWNIFLVKNPAPAMPGRGWRKLKQDYFLRRNMSREAPPGAADASVPGSGMTLVWFKHFHRPSKNLHG